MGDGETTFEDFLAQLTEEGTADGWAFKPRRTEIHSRRLVAVNRGGEFHTFTEVKRFGGGCIEFLNDLLGLTAVPECEPEFALGVPLAFVTTGVEAGARLRVDHLAPGRHRFLCLIHPWMRSTVRVDIEGEDD